MQGAGHSERFRQPGHRHPAQADQMAHAPEIHQYHHRNHQPPRDGRTLPQTVRL